MREERFYLGQRPAVTQLRKMKTEPSEAGCKKSEPENPIVGSQWGGRWKKTHIGGVPWLLTKLGQTLFRKKLSQLQHNDLPQMRSKQ